MIKLATFSLILYLFLGKLARYSTSLPLVSELRKLSVKLMNIGYSLVHTKDFTDIFIDLDECIISPWLGAGLLPAHLELALSNLLESYVTTATATSRWVHFLSCL